MAKNSLSLIFLLISFLFASCAFSQDFDFNKFQFNNKKKSNPYSQGSSPAVIKCGIKPALPPGWKVERSETNSLDASGPRGMWLAIVINNYGPNFPTESSLEAYKKSAINEKSQGKLISWQERTIDGARGIQRVEGPMPNPSDPRRITWVGYNGTVGINIVASSKSRDFDSCFNELNNVVGSIRW